MKKVLTRKIEMETLLHGRKACIKVKYLKQTMGT